jgi:hypothetical protein
MLHRRNVCLLYIIYTAGLNDWLSRNGSEVPEIFCRSEAEMWPSWSMTKRFTSLAVSHGREYIWAYVDASHFDITGKNTYIYLVAFAYFLNYVSLNTL